MDAKTCPTTYAASVGDCGERYERKSQSGARALRAADKEARARQCETASPRALVPSFSSSSKVVIARTHLEDNDKTDDVGEHRDDEEPRAREDVGDLGKDYEGARRGRPP